MEQDKMIISPSLTIVSRLIMNIPILAKFLTFQDIYEPDKQNEQPNSIHNNNEIENKSNNINTDSKQNKDKDDICIEILFTLQEYFDDFLSSLIIEQSTDFQSLGKPLKVNSSDININNDAFEIPGRLFTKIIKKLLKINPGNKDFLTAMFATKTENEGEEKKIDFSFGITFDKTEVSKIKPGFIGSTVKEIGLVLEKLNKVNETPYYLIVDVTFESDTSTYIILNEAMIKQKKYTLFSVLYQGKKYTDHFYIAVKVKTNDGDKFSIFNEIKFLQDTATDSLIKLKKINDDEVKVTTIIFQKVEESN